MSTKTVILWQKHLRYWLLNYSHNFNTGQNVTLCNMSFTLFYATINIFNFISFLLHVGNFSVKWRFLIHKMNNVTTLLGNYEVNLDDTCVLFENWTHKSKPDFGRQNLVSLILEKYRNTYHYFARLVSGTACNKGVPPEILLSKNDTRNQLIQSFISITLAWTSEKPVERGKRSKIIWPKTGI